MSDKKKQQEKAKKDIETFNRLKDQVLKERFVNAALDGVENGDYSVVELSNAISEALGRKKNGK